MIQLTYISTVTPVFSCTDLDDILRTSRKNNTTVGLTGLLLFNGKRFLQVIEGHEDDVHETYRRIKDDPRHRAIVLLSSKTISRRVFGMWAMAGQRVPAADSFDDLIAQVNALTEQVEDPNVKAHFRSFADLQSSNL